MTFTDADEVYWGDEEKAVAESAAAEEYERSVDQAMHSLSRDALEGGPKVRGTCGVCGAPVTDEDAPIRIEWTDGRPGVIHGTYDCLDQEQCASVWVASDPEVDPRVRQCLLMANHPPERHLFG